MEMEEIKIKHIPLIITVVKENYLKQDSGSVSCVCRTCKNKIRDKKCIKDGKSHWEYTILRSIVPHTKWHNTI